MFHGYYPHLVDIYVLRGYYPHFVEISMFRRYYPHFVDISTSRGYYPHFVDISTFRWYYPHFVDIIYIDHITSYLARNVRPIFHIYSFSESEWCKEAFQHDTMIVTTIIMTPEATTVATITHPHAYISSTSEIYASPYVYTLISASYDNMGNIPCIPYQKWYVWSEMGRNIYPGPDQVQKFLVLTSPYLCYFWCSWMQWLTWPNDSLDKRAFNN